MNTRVSLILCFVFALGGWLRGIAQQYSIDLAGIHAGGVVSTGGVYSVAGIIEPASPSVTMTNEHYSVEGGFWPLPGAIQSEGAPVLTISAGPPGFAVISWAPASRRHVLQELTSGTSTNWLDSKTGSTNPIVVPTLVPVKFYRLNSR